MKRRNNERFTEDQLNRFYSQLSGRRNRLIKIEKGIEKEEFHEWSPEDTGELSHTPLHKADFGTDTFEEEIAADLASQEISELQQIEDALNRIEKGRFGVCQDCLAEIPLSRLEVVPEARLCAECDQKQEQLKLQRKKGRQFERIDQDRA